MRYRETVSVLKACQMSFNGMKNNAIAEELGVRSADITRWRKLPLWEEFYTELLEVEKKALLDAQLRNRAETESPAQG